MFHKKLIKNVITTIDNDDYFSISLVLPRVRNLDNSFYFKYRNNQIDMLKS